MRAIRESKAPPKVEKQASKSGDCPMCKAGKKHDKCVAPSGKKKDCP